MQSSRFCVISRRLLIELNLSIAIILPTGKFPPANAIAKAVSKDAARDPMLPQEKRK